jgi:hypothetical protein
MFLMIGNVARTADAPTGRGKQTFLMVQSDGLWLDTGRS